MQRASYKLHIRLWQNAVIKMYGAHNMHKLLKCKCLSWINVIMKDKIIAACGLMSIMINCPQSTVINKCQICQTNVRFMHIWCLITRKQMRKKIALVRFCVRHFMHEMRFHCWFELFISYNFLCIRVRIIRNVLRMCIESFW